jgi:hypothetical protein
MAVYFFNYKLEKTCGIIFLEALTVLHNYIGKEEGWKS